MPYQPPQTNLVYFYLRNATDNHTKTIAWKQRQLWTFKDIGFIHGDDRVGLISLPMYSVFAQVPVADVALNQIDLQFKPNMPLSVINSFTVALLQSTGIPSFYRIYNRTQSTTQKIAHILGIVFDIIIALTMFLCFFALSANMSANLLEQTKEIGVLRSIGVTKMRIRMLFFYEAMILVLSSATTGVMIGMVVGYTMMVQEQLILSHPIKFFFPWQQFLIIIGLSIICAFVSTFGPTSQLVSKSISGIFRLV